MEIRRKLSDKYSVTIEHKEKCFTEKIPIEFVSVVCETGNYFGTSRDLWLKIDELRNLHKAITDYLNEIDAQNEDGKIPRIGLKADAETEKLLKQFECLTDEQKKELIDILIKY